MRQNDFIDIHHRYSLLWSRSRSVIWVGGLTFKHVFTELKIILKVAWCFVCLFFFLFSHVPKQVIFQSCGGNKLNTFCKMFVHIFPRISLPFVPDPLPRVIVGVPWQIKEWQGTSYFLRSLHMENLSGPICYLHLFVFLLAVSSFNGVPGSIFKLEELQTRDGAGAFSVQHGPDLSPFLKEGREEEDEWEEEVCRTVTEVGRKTITWIPAMLLCTVVYWTYCKWHNWVQFSVVSQMVSFSLTLKKGSGQNEYAKWRKYTECVFPQ